MKKSYNHLLAGIFIIFSLLAQTANADVNQSDPVKLVEELTSGILKELAEKQDAFVADPSKAAEFGRNYILPYVDNYKMSRYVVGRKWKTATQQQQDDFVQAFTDTIINSYSRSLVKLKIAGVEVVKSLSKRRGRSSVVTVATQKNGTKVDVIYRLFQSKKNQKWYIYDFSVEGISLLVNYRKTFASEISKKGLDQVILNMQNGLKESL